MLRRARRHDERGTVLLLMPTAVVILMVLGAICVDLATLFLAERELANLAAAAANDAASAGVDPSAFYDQNAAVVLDEGRADAAAELAWEAKQLDGIAVTSFASTSSGTEVQVVVEGEVDSIFAGAIIPELATFTARATATATARQR